MRVQGRGVSAERPHPEPAAHGAELSTGIDGARVVSFSDSVFAFAATLLVLSIDVPKSGSGLGDALLAEAPNLFAYALSFGVLGNFWIDHHKLFGRLAEIDGTTLWLTLLYLALIALVPFSCELIGEHGDTAVGVSVYGTNMVAVPLVFGVLCRRAVSRDVIAGGKQAREEIEATAFGGFLLATVFAVSIPLAILVSPEVATYSYLALFVVIPVAGRLRDRVRAARV